MATPKDKEPGAMPASTFEGHRLPKEEHEPRTKQEQIEADQAALSAARVAGARFTAGQWQAEDGTPLTDKEAQQAHRAMDRKAMAARERAMLGRNG
jgi:hypothetical protein